MQPLPRLLQAQVDREDLEGRITALENLAVTRATFLQQVHDDVGSLKQVLPQIIENISTLDGYAQNVDKRVTTVREEAANHFKWVTDQFAKRIDEI